MNKGRKIASITRRDFIVRTGIFGSALAITVSACKDIFRPKKAKLVYGDEQKKILKAVLQHLFPAESGSPGAKELNAIEYLSWVINDPDLRASKKQLLISGIGWTEDTANEMFKDSFVNLKTAQKEKVLRDLERYSRGRRWLSLLLTYLMEALLSDPLYGSNKNEIGWKWLGHVPGSPRPTKEQIYKAS